MIRFGAVCAGLLAASSIASAGDVLLAGHVQRVVLTPSDTGDCPPPCGILPPAPDGAQRICVTNAGGCEAMEVKIDRVYLGQAGAMHEFKSRIGEWGPRFPATTRQIVVLEEGGHVWLSVATERDGKVFIDPKRIRTIGGVPTAAKGKDDELVALDEVLERVHAKRD